MSVCFIGPNSIEAFIAHGDQIAHHEDERPATGRGQTRDGIGNALDKHAVERADKTQSNGRIARISRSGKYRGKNHLVSSNHLLRRGYGWNLTRS